MSSLLVYVLLKREIRHFHVVVVQKREKKCTNKCDAREKLLFCLYYLLFFFFFWTFSLPSASLDLKVPIVGGGGGGWGGG